MSSPRLFRAVLPVDDLSAADAFWARLLELEVDTTLPSRHYVPTGGAVTVLVDTAAHARGHGQEPPPFAPNPDAFYFRVPDLDATWARAQELGCPAPGEPEGAGIAKRVWGDRSFYTRDPAGNPICFVDDVHSDTTPDRVRYTGCERPSLRSVVLPTSSMGRSEGFFEELLGVEADTSIPNRHFFLLDDCQLSLVDPREHAKSHELEATPFRANPETVYIAVDDLDAAWERAQKIGMQALHDDDVQQGIHTYPWGERSFYGLDPCGNPISLVDEANLYLGAGRTEP